jgi:hypothetical protein
VISAFVDPKTSYYATSAYGSNDKSSYPHLNDFPIHNALDPHCYETLVTLGWTQDGFWKILPCLWATDKGILELELKNECSYVHSLGVKSTS